MNGNELSELFKKGGKRCHVIGTAENGVIAGLDLEGRLYAVMDGTVMNRSGIGVQRDRGRGIARDRGPRDRGQPPAGSGSRDRGQPRMALS